MGIDSPGGAVDGVRGGHRQPGHRQPGGRGERGHRWPGGAQWLV